MKSSGLRLLVFASSDDDDGGDPFAGVRAFYYSLFAQDRVYFSSTRAAGENRRRRRRYPESRASCREMEYYTVEMLTSSRNSAWGYFLAAASSAKFTQAVNCTRYIVGETSWARYRPKLSEKFRATDFFNARGFVRTKLSSFQRDRSGCFKSTSRAIIPKGILLCFFFLADFLGYKVLAFAKLLFYFLCATASKHQSIEDV